MNNLFIKHFFVGFMVSDTENVRIRLLSPKYYRKI